MSYPFPRHAVSLYGQTPVPPWKARRMAALHRRLGTLRYRQVRLSMDLAVSHQRLRRLIREVAALREQEALR